MTTIPTPEAIPSPRPLHWPPILDKLRTLLATSSQPIYLVGGAVRDAYLGRPIHDLDFVTSDDGRYPAKRIANALRGSFYPLDEERGVGRALVDFEGEPFVIDIARARGHSLADDLAARDFTVNALAVPLAGDGQQIIDVVGGMADMAKKRLRRCGPTSISDDPIRALRAVRQSVALGFLIEPETREDIRRYGPGISSSSVERVRDEFLNMLGGSRPHVALRALDMLGLLALIVPETVAMHGVTQSPPHVFDVWEHTLNVIERLEGILTTISPERNSDNAAEAAYGMVVYVLDRFRHPLWSHITASPSGRALLVLSALLHDCAKPETRSIDERGRIHFYRHEERGADLALERAMALRLSKDDATRIEAIVRGHMRPMNLHDHETISRRTLFRFWNATGSNGVDICILTEADYLGMVGMAFDLQDWIKHLQTVETLLDAYFNQREAVVAPPSLVTGRDLILRFKLKPGPEIGRMLRAITEAQAAGEITTADAALALAESLLGSPSSDDG